MIAATGAQVVAHRREEGMLAKSGVPLDLPVEDGDEVAVGDLLVRIIHTPGHTPGGICLLIDGRKLITGDTLFIGDVGRTDLDAAVAVDVGHRLVAAASGRVIVPVHVHGLAVERHRRHAAGRVRRGVQKHVQLRVAVQIDHGDVHSGPDSIAQ